MRGIFGLLIGENDDQIKKLRMIFTEMKPLQSMISGQFADGVLWNIGSLVILAVGGLLINGLVVRARGQEALGVFNQVYAVYIVLSQVGVGGLQYSTLKHISYAQDAIDTCSDITFVALVLIFSLTIPISILGTLLAESIGMALNSSAVATGLVIVMPGLVFFAANKVLINVLSGLRKMRAFALFRSFRFILIPLFIVALLRVEVPMAYLPLALTLSELVLFFVLVLYIYIGGQILIIKWPQNFIQHSRSHLSYGIRGMMSGVLIGLNTRIDVLMLGLFMSDQTVGLYSFAATLAEGFAQLPVAVRYNVDPVIGRYFSTDQRAKIPQLASQIRRVFWPAMIILGILALVIFPLVFVLLAGIEGFRTSWLVFGILILTHISIAGYTPMRGALLQGGMPGTYTVIILVVVLNNIVLNQLLIPFLGIYGPAVTTGCSYVLEITLIVIFSRRLLGIKF